MSNLLSPTYGQVLPATKSSRCLWLSWCLAVIPALTSIVSVAGSAQADDGVQSQEAIFDDTLFDTGYTALAVKSGKVLGSNATFVGAQGGFDANRYLSLGGAVYGLTTKLHSNHDGAGVLNFHYFGVLAESKFYTYRFATATAGLLVGGGQTSYKLQPDAVVLADDGSPSDKRWFSSSARVIEPTLGGLVRLNHRASLGFNIGQRYVSGVKLQDVSGTDLSGMTATVLLRGDF